MTNLAIAALAFFLLHAAVSGTRLRDVLVSALGERVYVIVYSLASVGGIVWLAMSYNAAVADAPTQLWVPGMAHRHLAITLMALAMALAIPGLLTPGPTTAMMDRTIGTPTGIHRITRHPFLWGVTIWAAAHLIANGDAASAILFGMFFVLALNGTRSIDAKRARKHGADWDAYAAKSSNVPFAAVFSGRSSISIGEIGAIRLGAAALAFVGILFAHPYIFGVAALPG